MKFCNACGTEKPHDDYYKKKHPSGNYGLSPRCKECTKKQRRDIWASPEGRERLTWNNVRSRYGIEKEQFDALLEAQNNACGICGGSLNDKCCIDHNHSTGTVRGLLCDSCNRGIGLLKDSVSVLSSAVDYLNRNGSYERSDTRSSQAAS